MQGNSTVNKTIHLFASHYQINQKLLIAKAAQLLFLMHHIMKILLKIIQERIQNKINKEVA